MRRCAGCLSVAMVVLLSLAAAPGRRTRAHDATLRALSTGAKPGSSPAAFAWRRAGMLVVRAVCGGLSLMSALVVLALLIVLAIVVALAIAPRDFTFPTLALFAALAVAVVLAGCGEGVLGKG